MLLNSTDFANINKISRLRDFIETVSYLKTVYVFAGYSCHKLVLCAPAKEGSGMRNIIEELYYGNITPCDRDIIKGGSYSHLLHLLTRNEDALVQTLTQAQQETFEKFKDCASEISDTNKVTAFTIGFKLGMRLALEAMISTSDITDPKMN